MFSELSLLLSLGLIFSARHLKWRLFTTHLGVSTPSKWRDSLFHKHLLISSPFLFFFPFPYAIIPYFCSFMFGFLHHLVLLFHVLYFCTFIIIIIIFVFSFFPLEVNLHTHLTTWLSSCQVGIFFGFLTIIANPKTSKQKSNP